MAEMEDFTEAPEFDGVLDLTGADESAGKFDAFEAGTYEAIVAKAEWKATKPEGGGSLPGNTPFLNIQYAIETEEDGSGTKIKNRRVFQKLFVAPDGHAKVAYHRGVFLNTLLALGYTREEISKKGFKVDTEALIGNGVMVTVDRKYNDHTKDFDNNVRGVKPVGEGVASGAGALV